MSGNLTGISCVRTRAVTQGKTHGVVHEVVECSVGHTFQLFSLPVVLLQFSWPVQKVSRILNFRGLRIFDFRFFCAVMLVLISHTYADNFGDFKYSVNF